MIQSCPTCKLTKKMKDAFPVECYITFVALLATYLLTSSKDLYWFDSAELALAGVQNGISHPPGQPLHTLLLHILSKTLPLAPLHSICILSPLAGALCTFPIWNIAETLIGKKAATARTVKFMLFAFIYGGGIIPFIWESASRIEVYSLAALLGLSQIALAMDRIENRKEFTKKFWATEGFLSGLGLSVNPIIAILSIMPLFILLPVTTKKQQIRINSSLWLYPAGIIIGLLPYLNLIIISSNTDRYIWGNYTNFKSMWFYLSGRDYAANMGATAPDIINNLLTLAIWNFKRGTLYFLLAGGIGIVAIALNRKWFSSIYIAISSTASIVWVVLNKPYFPDVPDFQDYLIEFHWFMVIGCFALFTIIISRRKKIIKIYLFQATSIIWICFSALLPPPLWERSRHSNTMARQVAMRILSEAPPHSILIVSSDHIFFPLMYLTEGEKKRQDVVVFNAGWASSSWYYKMIYSRHSELRKFSLKAPSRWERIKNFLDANWEREVIAENIYLASLTGRKVCMGGWSVFTGKSCMRTSKKSREKSRREARRQLMRWINIYGKRWTIDERILSFIGVSWGHDERIMGKPVEAIYSYLAGAGVEPPQLKVTLEEVDKMVKLLPARKNPILLSTPARNISYASELISVKSPEMSTRLKELSLKLSY